jgi:hypothetical protein
MIRLLKVRLAVFCQWQIETHQLANRLFLTPDEKREFARRDKRIQELVERLRELDQSTEESEFYILYLQQQNHSAVSQYFASDIQTISYVSHA